MTLRSVSPIKKRYLQKAHKAVFSVGIFALLMALVPFGSVPVAKAALLTSSSATFSKVTESVTSDLSGTGLQFTTSTGIALNATVTITFPAGFTVSTIVAADVTLKDNGSALTVAGSPTAANYGWSCVSLVCTLTAPSASNAILATHTVQIITTNSHITNPTAGSYKIAIAGSFGDTKTIAVTFLSSATSPITVDATIDPTVVFTWTGGAQALHFGTMTGSNVYSATTTSGATSETTSGLGFTVGTNAASGVAVTVSGTPLTGAGHTFATSATPTTLASGTEFFGLRVARSGSGSTSAATEYAGGTGSQYGFTNGTSTMVSSSGVSLTDTYTLWAEAAISATATPPGSYTTTLTFVATGTF